MILLKKVSNDETCKEGSAEELCQDFGLEIEIQAEKSQEEASNVSDINVVLSEEKKDKELSVGSQSKIQVYLVTVELKH